MTTETHSSPFTRGFRATVKEALLVTIGTALMAAAIILFIQPNQMTIGGIPGIAVPLHYMTGLPTGILMLLINVPIFLYGIKHLGRIFGIRSVFAIVLFSLFTDLFGTVLKLPGLTNEFILATLYGGTLMGVGLGLVLRAGSSTGGTAIVAQVLANRLNVKVGQLLMISDFIILCFGAVYFKNVEIVLWGLLFSYIMAQVIDYVLAGPPVGKIAYIISDHLDQINQQVIKELKRGGTLFSGHGIYTRKERKMLMVVVDNSEVIPLKRMVQVIDPNAFIIISNTFEILGEGFPIPQ